MKVRQQRETKERSRGRPKKKVSTAKTSVPDNDVDEVIVLDTSSSEAATPNVISLLDSTDESINSVVNNSRAYSEMKQIRIELPDLAKVPGALSSEQLDYLTARRLNAKNKATKAETRRIQKKHKKMKIKKESITKAISISSDSIEGGAPTLDRTVTPKRSKKESRNSKKRPRETQEKAVESMTPLAFGERASSEASISRIDNKNDFNEKSISICGSSIESAGRASMTTTTTTTTTTTVGLRKRKRREGELEIHSFTADLEESSRRQRKRNSTKRQKNDATLKTRSKQGVGRGFVNEKSGLSEKSSVDRVDSPKASRNEAAQGDKLTDAVDDSAGTASIAPVDEGIASGNASSATVIESIVAERASIVPVNESIESGRASITSVNESIASGNASIAPVTESIESGRASIALVNENIESGKESIAGRKESIAADRRVANNDSAVNKPDKASAVNDGDKTSAINDEGKSFDHSPVANGDLINEDFSSLQPFLDCDTDIKMIRLETNEDERLTLFSASDNDADHALDKEPCSLASIVEAIDNDLAGGNQPIGLPIAGIDNTEIMSLLPNPPMSNNEGNQSEDIGRRLNASLKSHESFDTSPANKELLPILDNGNGSFESNANRKLPAIIEDNILAEGTIGYITPVSLQTIRANRKRKKLSQTAVSTPASSVDDNRNFADSIEITLTHDENLSDSINEWEIDALLDENYDNNDRRASAKGGRICEDALNNNQETTVMNKNEVNSEKQGNIIKDYSVKPVTSHIEGDSCKEYNALKCLLDMGPEALDKAIADGAAGSDHDSFDGRQIDEALSQFENAIITNNSKSNIVREALNGEAKPVGTLTVQNLNKFNDRVGLVETESKPTSLRRRETVDTDASSKRTDNTNDSARMRKRKWISSNGEKPASSPSKSCTIQLNRRNWADGSQKLREKCRDVEQPIDRGLEPEDPVPKVAKIEDKKNYTKNPVMTQTVSMINEMATKLFSPIKNAQGCVNEIGAFVPDFGGSSLINLATSTPTKNDVAPVIVSGSDETSGSSGSSSSSDSKSGSSSSSSSSSSDKDSSDESDDEDTSAEVEIIEEPKVVSTKNSEAPCNSDSGTKSSTKTTRQTVEEKTLASFGADPGPVATEKCAGSLITDCDDPEKSDDDKSDCISLYTESLCTSRPGSPECQVSLTCSALAVSPQKQQKRSNVRSRLGPRVQTQPNAATAATAARNNSKLTERGPPTPASNIVECTPAANDEVAVESVPTKVQDRLVAPNVIQVCPEATASVVLDPTAINRMEQRHIEILFRGQCFPWLKQGFCRNVPCRFQHTVQPQLRYQLFATPNTRAIILHAIGYGYLYFINVIFQSLMSAMSVRQIIQFGIDLCTSRTLTLQQFATMIKTLESHRLTLVEVVGLFDSMMPNSDVDSTMHLIEFFYTLLEPGSYWNTMKKLMTKFSEAKLPINAVTAVLDECVKLHRNKMHVDDVHDNLIVKLTNETRLALGGDLLKTFYDLRYATVVDETNGPPVEAVKKSNWSCSIASPDSVRESVDFPLAAQLADLPPCSSPTPVVELQIAPETSKPPSVSQNEGASTSGCESYTLKHLDKLAPPKSAYNLWKFHLDLQGVQQGLLHNDYDHVIKILTALQEDPNRLPHIAGFYNILCKEIMSSRHHLEEIVRRTVQSGATDELRRFVYDLGVCVLTTLADTGAWVLAYQLLKTFKVYGQYNTCAFTLLSAEIYIANHRPLKALAILKQSRLVFTNTRNWNQMWCPNDEALRVSVMELLLSSLCDGYAEHALSLLEFILGDQCSSIKPINISRYTDRVAAALLKEDLTNAVVDLGRLIVENNLLVSSRIFRALINRIIHSDQFLAKQLHRYATWLGTYNMPKISGITHLIVNIDWTEEEMYLIFSSLLHDLYINIGHAIDRLRPRQLAVYLILEPLPTERQLLMDISGPPLTNAEIRKRRAIVKSVFERFDPKIKVVQRLQGKLCKIQSASLVNYLKAGHFKC